MCCRLNEEFLVEFPSFDDHVKFPKLDQWLLRSQFKWWGVCHLYFTGLQDSYQRIFFATIPTFFWGNIALNQERWWLIMLNTSSSFTSSLLKKSCSNLSACLGCSTYSASASFTTISWFKAFIYSRRTRTITSKLGSYLQFNYWPTLSVLLPPMPWTNVCKKPIDFRSGCHRCLNSPGALSHEYSKWLL